MILDKGFVGVLAILICIYIASMTMIGKATDEKIDIAHINKITNEINTRYQTNKQLENQKEYEIIYCADEDYLSKLIEAMNENAIIMDLTREEKLEGKIIFSSGLRADKKIQKQLMACISILFGVVLVLFVATYCYIHFYI